MNEKVIFCDKPKFKKTNNIYYQNNEKDSFVIKTKKKGIEKIVLKSLGLSY